MVMCLVAGGLWAAIPEGIPRWVHAMGFLAAAATHVHLVARNFRPCDAVLMASATTAACFGRVIVVISAHDTRGVGLTIYSLTIMGLFTIVSWYIAQEVINREVRILLRGRD